MSEYTDLLERARERFPTPELPVERVIVRHERRIRNQRIGAGILALALVVGGLGAAWSVIRSAERVRPGDGTLPILLPEPQGPCLEGDPCFDTDVFVVRTDGSDLTRIGDDPARDVAYAWSPDGSTIAFHRVHDDQADVFTMGADGSELRQLTDDPGLDGFPVFSPDGTMIAFASAREGADRYDEDIYVMNLDGTGVVRLTRFEDDLDSIHPTWSPDGEQIAFIRGHAPPGTKGKLWVMQADGSNAHALLDEPFVAFPTWSPDGTRIAFAWAAHGESRIGVLDLESGRVDDLGPGDLANWSPDSSRLAISDPGGGIEIIDLADQSRTLIVGEGGVPIWSPDGEWLAFTRQARP